MIELCNKYLNGSDLLDNRSFERIHRLGHYKQGKNRVVIARMANFKDKVRILKLSKALKDNEEIVVSEDFPTEIEKRRKQLYPIMGAIKSKMSSQEKSKVFLRADQLIVRGKSYSLSTLKLLPEEFNLNKLFTVTRDDVTAFFSRNSVLSNHFACQLTVNGKSYANMEQFLVSCMAKTFEDHDIMQQVQDTHDPIEVKHLGKRIQNFKMEIWRKKVDAVLQEGLYAKFDQNQELKAALLNTGHSTIVEANPHDQMYGVGLSLRDNRVFDPEQWRGENLMGRALMQVRSLFVEEQKNNKVTFTYRRL